MTVSHCKLYLVDQHNVFMNWEEKHLLIKFSEKFAVHLSHSTSFALLDNEVCALSFLQIYNSNKNHYIFWKVLLTLIAIIWELLDRKVGNKRGERHAAKVIRTWTCGVCIKDYSLHAWIVRHHSTPILSFLNTNSPLHLSLCQSNPWMCFLKIYFYVT